ncbi:glutamate decarboxylase [Nocardia sp. NPDC006630]|uniref:glutamate decarboxylase n=1 Tax=Nocardia sp. NPDC006630 TaxID=3157181 RepID=UPI0033AAB69E
MTLHAHSDANWGDLDVSPLYSHSLDETVIPRTRLADFSIAPSMAVAIVRDELLLDGREKLNVASFCSTYLEPELALLAAENLTKNIANHDQYPASVEIERRCLAIIGDLWHSNEITVGVATTGSSEAVMLAVLAFRQRWRESRSAGTSSELGTPNIVFSSACHPCWDKACLYFDVEPRKLPIRHDQTTLDPAEVAAACDENTIGVVATLGYPATGRYDPVLQISEALDALAARGGPDIGIHVDAASGGFYAPFQPDAAPWDFQLPRVVSIDASSHKFGLANLGLGWALWRERQYLPESLTFQINLLGGEPAPTFSLTYSRPAAPVIDQYATFLRLGRPGFAGLVAQASRVAAYLAEAIAERGFRIWGDGSDLPVIAFGTHGPDGPWMRHFSAKLRERGWQVPTYTLAPDAEDTVVARIVCRYGLTLDLAERLVRAIDDSIGELDAHDGPLPDIHRDGFAH